MQYIQSWARQATELLTGVWTSTARWSLSWRTIANMSTARPESIQLQAVSMPISTPVRPTPALHSTYNNTPHTLQYKPLSNLAASEWAQLSTCPATTVGSQHANLFLLQSAFTYSWWPCHQLDLQTHTHPFNDPLSGTTRVSWYQKGKTNLDFTEARDSEWQWHQLGHTQVCISLQTDNHASTTPLRFYKPDALPAAQTNLQTVYEYTGYTLSDVKHHKYHCHHQHYFKAKWHKLSKQVITTFNLLMHLCTML